MLVQSENLVFTPGFSRNKNVLRHINYGSNFLLTIIFDEF